MRKTRVQRPRNFSSVQTDERNLSPVHVNGMKEGKILKEIWQDLLDDGLKLCYNRFLVHMKNMYPEYKSHKGGHPSGSKVDNTAVMKRLKKEDAKNKDIQKPMIQASAVNPTKLYIYTCNPEYGVDKKTGECSNGRAKTGLLATRLVASMAT